MDTNYVIILDFCGGYLNIIHLTEEEKKESEKYEDFESFLSTLEEKYGFRLKDCNWMTTETLQPKEQKAGYPFRYFPSDFRLGDPHLPGDNDPKVFTHNGHDYYLPWESTICISQCWFYNTKDNSFKSVDELEKLYRHCTKNDNVLILNCPPDRDGRLRAKDAEILRELRDRIGL